MVGNGAGKAARGALPARPPFAGLRPALLALTALLFSPAIAKADTVFNTPVSGVMAGPYQLNYPFVGNGDVVSIAMRYSGGNPSLDPGVGFIVFQDTNVVVNEPASVGNAYALPTVSGLNYDVQAYNYVPGFSTIFHLVMTDPGLVKETGGDLARDRSVQGQLAGKAGGGLDNYTFGGDGQPVTFVLDARPRDPIPDGGVGLAVWDQWGNMLQNVSFQHAIAPSGAIVWTLPTVAGTSYVVQVFNYQAGWTIGYVLAAL